jgi:hypothetical protein
MSNSVNKLYEQCNYNSTKAKAIEEDVALLHSKKHTNSSNIMLQSLLNGSLFNSGELKPFAFNADGLDCGDCGDCNEYEENTDLDEIKKLNIDFNNELLLSEEQIEDLLNITPANSNISIHEIITNDETTINVEAPVQEAPVQEAPVQEAPQTEEPVPEEPVPTEEHVSSEHVSTEHVPTEHVPTETLSTEPLSTEHVPTEPLPTEPAI